MLQALNWLFLTSLPRQKVCCDASLQGLMSIQIYWTMPTSDLSKVCQNLWKVVLRSHDRTFIALHLSSQALKPLYMQNNSGIDIWQAWSLSRAQKKTELKKPWCLPHHCSSAASDVQVMFWYYRIFTCIKSRADVLFPFSMFVFQQSHWLSNSAQNRCNMVGLLTKFTKPEA